MWAYSSKVRRSILGVFNPSHSQLRNFLDNPILALFVGTSRVFVVYYALPGGAGRWMSTRLNKVQRLTYTRVIFRLEQG